MNGPQHYLEAERLIEESRDDRCDYQGAQVRIAAAQVHSTLALAAATVLSGVLRNTVAASHPVNELAHDDETVDAVNAWHEAAAR
ncbi:hypothetical protein KNU56_gp55 [Gordonia phage Arri]|uniref:Uncharacterized protein n=1 Tax=Gordonia phage Arri TaxID=2588127 RepID=A0A4Y5U159_9CAUD|nr:hypothetical protein KNU56_gp55 [Gordonia phage Arri]QDB74832.1 hypothetical protein SEA_ARRI_55 [Gordonia phage Arri]